MISLLVSVLILILVFGALYYVLQLIPLPAPFGQIALIILGLIFVLVLISMLLPLVGVHPFYSGPIR